MADIPSKSDTRSTSVPFNQMSIFIIIEILLVGLLLLAFLYGASIHLTEINLDPGRSDQGAYMDYARNMWETNHAYIGGRNRMPIYPYLQSLLYNPTLTDEAFFFQGKLFTIGLTLLMLVGLYIAYRRSLERWQAVPLILVTAFTAYMFKAAYFQADLLYYTLSFFALCYLTLTFIQPDWRNAATAGVLLGLSWLTKASVQPMLYMFIIAFAAKGLYAVAFDKRPIRQALSQYALPLALVILCFLGVVFVYIDNSKRYFTKYFYNVNSTFYMWYDSWSDVKDGTRAAGDRVGWPNLPDEQIPGPEDHLTREALSASFTRLQEGAAETFRLNCVWNDITIGGIEYRAPMVDVYHMAGFGYCQFAALYALGAIVSVTLAFSSMVKLLWRHKFMVLFWLGTIGIYLLLYSWYAAIAAGPRFAMGILLPVLIVSAWVIYAKPSQAVQFRLGKLAFKWTTLFTIAVMLLFVLEFFLIMTVRIQQTYAGQ